MLVKIGGAYSKGDRRVRAVKRGKQGDKSSISTHLGVMNAIVVQRNAALALSRRFKSTS